MRYRPIFVQLAGGLGNQLFVWQYAHVLEKSSHWRIYLLDYYVKEDLRKCELYPISVNCQHKIRILKLPNILNPFKIYDYFKSKNENSPMARLLSRFTFNCKTSHDAPSPSLLKGKLFVRGYFQDCAMVSDGLRVTKIEIYKYIDAVNIAENAKNDANQAQVLHVRRGDYKENKTTIGVLKDCYFTNNLQLNLPYIIHTDENAPQKSRLFQNALRIYGEDSSPWLVLAHASKANVFIGSNSTLSWWAAVLNKIENAIIKLPSPWYFSSSYSEEAMYLAKAKYVKAHFRETNK
jgi:hypothetical protein